MAAPNSDFDASTWFATPIPHANAGLAVLCRGHILLGTLKKSGKKAKWDGKLGLPAGDATEDEQANRDPWATALRELNEETRHIFAKYDLRQYIRARLRNNAWIRHETTGEGTLLVSPTFVVVLPDEAFSCLDGFAESKEMRSLHWVDVNGLFRDVDTKEGSPFHKAVFVGGEDYPLPLACHITPPLASPAVVTYVARTLCGGWATLQALCAHEPETK